MRAIRFRPSSHSDDYTVIATYKDEQTAEKVKDALLRMLDDMQKHPESYDVDWSSDEVSVSADGKSVFFEVYTAGYLECVESVLRKVAKPVNIECYQNFQQLEIRVKVPKGLTPDSAVLVMDKEEGEAVKWLVKNCGSPDCIDCDDGTHQVFRWFYRGDEIYYDGALNIGFEFLVDERENWEVYEF